MVMQVCTVVPTVEEKSDEVDVCHIEPEKVSNQFITKDGKPHCSTTYKVLVMGNVSTGESTLT